MLPLDPIGRQPNPAVAYAAVASRRRATSPIDQAVPSSFLSAGTLPATGDARS